MPVKSLFLVRQKGLEPPTYWFVASHSIQLSYWRTYANLLQIRPTRPRPLLPVGSRLFQIA